MNKIIGLVVGCLMFSSAYGGNVLTGKTKLACEAILCLAGNSGVPSECSPSLSYYWDIDGKHVVKKRKAFLNLCPVSGESGMKSLINLMAQGGGFYNNCDATVLVNKLNAKCTETGLGMNSCLKDIPSYCKQLAAHSYTNILLPVYEESCGYKMELGYTCTKRWYIPES